MTAVPSSPRRGRLQFVGLAAIFAAPVIGAYVLFLFPQWVPSGRTNYGRIEAPKALPEWSLSDAKGEPVPMSVFQDKWTLVQLGAAACDAVCEQRLIFTRQLRLSLNEKRVRVQRIYLADDAARLSQDAARLHEGQPDLLWLSLPPAAADAARTFFQPATQGSLYLIDPLGHWVMSYPYAPGEEATAKDFKGLQKDIKKLLKYSSS